MRDVTARQSRTTHAAREAVDACVAFADMLADAIAGAPRSHVLRPREVTCAPAIASILAGSWRGAHRNAIRSTGYVVHALEASLWCTGRTGIFDDAVLTATNLGEDADTTGVITGQLAGALYGANAIAPRWKGKLVWCQRITDTARALFEASLA